MFIIVSRVLSEQKAEAGGFDMDPRTTQTQVGGTITVAVLLGVAWLFAVFAIKEGFLALEIIFAIANVLQAVLLFIFRCLLYYEAKEAWRQLCDEGTFRRPRGSPLSSNTPESPLASRSRARQVFSTNPVITNTNVNVWHNNGQEAPRTRSGNRLVSLKYGRQNVNFADPLEARGKRESGVGGNAPGSAVRPSPSAQGRRRTDGYAIEDDPDITEL